MSEHEEIILLLKQILEHVSKPRQEQHYHYHYDNSATNPYPVWTTANPTYTTPNTTIKVGEYGP